MNQTNDNTKRLLSPTNDIVFQYLFGNPKNESMTRDFISKELKREIGELDLKQNPKLIPTNPNEKYGVVDVRSKEQGTQIQFDIEMQMTSSDELMNRMLYYWSKLYSQQLIQGLHYDALKPTILILILNDKNRKLQKIQEYHTKWKITEEKYKDIILTDDFEMHIIEIDKLKGIKNETTDELKYWIEFLVNPKGGGKMLENEEIQKAQEELERINSDEQLRRLAELRERWEIDRRQDMAYRMETRKIMK